MASLGHSSSAPVTPVSSSAPQGSKDSGNFPIIKILFLLAGVCTGVFIGLRIFRDEPITFYDQNK